MAIIGLACLAFSPVGAVIAGTMAYRQRLGTVKYAVAGLFYSMAFVIPFGYLVARMNGERPRAIFVWFAYLVLYLLWLIGPVAGGFLILDASDSVV